MSVRIRGIYATALTEVLDDVVLSSETIADRFDRSVRVARPEALVEMTSDRQGVCVTGEPDPVAAITEDLLSIGLDSMAWEARLGQAGIFAGEVTETVGGGAVVECGGGEGYLPFDRTDHHVTEGDTLRVQVATPRPPWSNDRPELRTQIRIPGPLLSLVRGMKSDDVGQPGFSAIVPAEPPDDWGVRWHAAEDDDIDLETLGAALEAATEQASAVDNALADAPQPGDREPGPYWPGETTRFVWFGRDSRFALDDHRREVTATMPGHHRIKAGTASAGAAVDFVEAVCPEPDGATEEASIPFDVLTRQFGPREGDTVRLDHGKPDGRRLVLGRAEVRDRSPDGTVTLERQMTPGGEYDGLGVERRAGDVAVTKVREGRWWYPTVYRSAEGNHRGTYVNICTPVEIFPDSVRYVDLHVDVLKHADGEIERVDDDELEEAVSDDRVSDPLAEKARAVASAVESAL